MELFLALHELPGMRKVTDQPLANTVFGAGLLQINCSGGSCGVPNGQAEGSL